jgi:ATP-dependent Clp protease ATP-binding subunit ClpC
MFERYTEQARRAIFFARYEAVFQPAREISTSHILICLTRDAGSRADVVGSLNMNTVQLRSALGIPYPVNAPVLLASEQNIPLNDNSKKVLAYAAEEAYFDDEYWIDTDHLLRGLLRFPNEASDVLQSISLDLAKVREASKLHRKKFPAKKTLYHRLFGRPYKAHRVTLAKWIVALMVCVLAALLIRLFN